MAIEELSKFRDQLTEESEKEFAKFLQDNADSEVKNALIKFYKDRFTEIQHWIFILESFHNPELCKLLIRVLDPHHLAKFLEAVHEDEGRIEEELRIKNDPFAS